MNAISRINKQIVNGFIILAVILSLLPTTVPVSSQAPAQPEQIRSDGIRYGSGWNDEEIPPTSSDESEPSISDNESLVQQSIAPEEVPEIFISVEPQIYIPGKSVNLTWNMPDFDKAKENFTPRLKVTIPKGATPLDKSLIVTSSEDGTGSIDIIPEEAIDTTAFNIDPSQPFPQFFAVDMSMEGKKTRSVIIEIDTAKYTIAKEKGGSIDAFENKIYLDIPAKAINENLAFDVRNPSPNHMPPVSLTGNPVEIIAAGIDSGKNINKFNSPITIQVNYEGGNLFGRDEKDLMLFYYNEAIADWYPLETTVDVAQKTLTAQTDHLTVFDYKAVTWQAYMLPTVDNFKVANFTGAATYDISLWTPPGPGGLQPSLSLSYNSQVIDESTAFAQASWVGMGWSLDTGAITTNMHGTEDTADDTNLLSLGGTSGVLLPIGQVTQAGITTITYKTADDNFLKIEGKRGEFEYTNNTWTVYGKDGSVYQFEQADRVLTSTQACADSSDDLNITWRWSLTWMKDKYQNQITYTYTKDLKPSCINQIAAYPDTITYGGGHYQVKFNLEARNDYKNSWTTTSDKTLFGKRRLASVDIKSNTSGNWVTVRKYKFSYYDDNSYIIYPGLKWAPTANPTPTYPTLTLLKVQEWSGDGTTLSLPPVSFTYSDSIHLTQVNNGQGGRVEMQYENWNYFDDVNKDIRDFKQQMKCTPPDLPSGWEVGSGLVRCDESSTNLQLGQIGTGQGTAYGTFLESMVKPGGRYRVHIVPKAISSSSSVVWGLIDKSTLDTQLPGSATVPQAYTHLEVSVDMPVTYNPAKTSMLISCSNCRIGQAYDPNDQTKFGSEIVLFPNYWRVSSRIVTDLVKNTSRTFTYKYDNASPNNSTVSEGASAVGLHYTPINREFRGHSMTQEINPDKLATVNWYYQNDTLKGRAYHSLAIRQDSSLGDLYDAMESIDSTKWVSSGSGSGVTFTSDSPYGVDFDYATKVTSNHTAWDVYLARNAFSLANGKAVVTHMKLSGTLANAQAKVDLVNAAGSQIFGVIVQPESGKLVARSSYKTGATEQSGSALISDFKLDTWYVVMLFVDSVNGFRVRMWQTNNPEAAGEAVVTGFGSSTWKFRGFSTTTNATYPTSLWLDAYYEGIIYSESEFHYSPVTEYDTITGGTYPDLPNTTLMTFKDLKVTWAQPTYSVSRTYSGNSSWYATRVDYRYDLADQHNAGTVQYGNLTATIYSVWDWQLQAWVAHHASRTEYWLNTAAGKYLIDFPARQTTIDCASTCNLTANPLLGETLYFYDNQSSYQTAPTVGKLTLQRSLMDTNGGNRYGENNFVVDSWGNVTSITTYSGYGTAISSPTSGSRTATRTYDNLIHTYMLTETLPVIAPNPAQVTTTAYDYNLGVPIKVTDPNGAQTGAAYDILGRMTAICASDDWDGITCSSAGSPTLKIEYNPYASPSSPFYILLTQKLDTSRTMQIARYYNGLGELLQEQTVNAEVEGSAAKIVVDYQYDTLGRLVKQRKPYTYISSLAFQAQSFPPSEVTTTTYDILGRVTSISEPNTNTVTTTYGLQYVSPYWLSRITSTDPNGSATTDPNDNITATLYDAWGLPKTVTPPTGPGLRYTYDKLGRLLTAEKMNGSTTLTTTTINYDLAGRKVNMTDPDMGYWSYAYDASGNLTRQTDPRTSPSLNTTCLFYDELNRLKGKTYRTDTSCPTTDPDYTGYTIKYKYDEAGADTYPLGRRTSMTDISGATTWKYDLRGRMTSETRTIDGVSYTTGYAYNSADLPIRMTYPNDEEVTLAYNSQGALQSIKRGTDFTYVNNLTYDVDGRTRTMQLGASGSAGALSRTFTYYPWNTDTSGGRLSNLVTAGTAGTIQNLDYTLYDRNGNLKGMTDLVNGGTSTSTLSYDALNRLMSMNTTGSTNYNEAFHFDDTGRMDTKTHNGGTAQTLSYDPNHYHAVAAYNGNSYQYDAAGNMYSRTVGGQNYTLGYD